LIGFDRQQGREPTPELERDWFAAAYFCGRGDLIQTDRLMAIAADRRLDPRLRDRAAWLLVAIADDTAHSRLASEAAESIHDISLDERLTAQMMYDAVFGSLDQAVRAANAIVLQDPPFENDLARYDGLHNAGVALWRGGEMLTAISALQASWCVAERGRLWAGCAGAGAQLAEVFWYAGDLIAANHWFEKTGVHLARTRFQDGGVFNYAIGVMLALSGGQPDEAERLLNRAAELYPNLGNRRLLEFLAYRVRISLVRAQIPSEADVSRLLSGHLAFRALGVQDIVADTLLWALESVGRGAEASELKEQYLAVHRRHLHGATPA
jgi:tetratricopeptide (TPR) repeat protein